MKTIGLIGGMSFESSLVYYRMINEAVRNRLGGLNSAEVILHSVDFARIVALQKAGRWDCAAKALSDVATRARGRRCRHGPDLHQHHASRRRCRRRRR